ncbi:glycoside hydrolase family 15 protein [Marinilabilia salmonicolor]|uniref:GH15 family glucan-1,4-alpha-glucosidase n=1 Tax=Marinilabilia salmonicolor TaxID=989 RepID=A0A368VB44_9BACT|nr:glycoside hydrolase family 15 protein [Marinilabilia salmonicolor]RCW38332.1 GH15 family glucan-1,4-alpha-glucosidase [Marinilabilia salmonicolor]
MAYQKIENYGIIGNMRTSALIGTDGSIDWMCYPRFDSPSMFGRILDQNNGGYFKISPVDPGVTKKQFYWPDTNVLITRFLCNKGVLEVIDYMPVGETEIGENENRLVRWVKAVRGCMRVKVECFPGFNYARDSHKIVLTSHGAGFYSDSQSIALSTPVSLKAEGQGVIAEFDLKEGESANFVLREPEGANGCEHCFNDTVAYNGLVNTIEYWNNWVRKCTYKGRWRETVIRSALTLKLLTYDPTGAIVAAPTCSLPESPGGERNWDYRFTWIRDAAFTIYALMRIGFTDEAERFMGWIGARCHELRPDGSMQIMYGIDGRHELEEQILTHLEGYRESSPVRVGNGAADQLQLDIYGELLDSVYLYNKYGSPISFDLWVQLRKLINWVAKNWHHPDEGIWEVRGGKQHFVYSKLMCWVALDRGIRLADKRSFPSDKNFWMKERDKIYEEIMDKGWNKEIKAFVQYYGSETLDASNLMMPLTFFLSPSDSRMLSTLAAIHKTPDEGGLVADSLVYRYHSKHMNDGFDSDEGTFNICTFWMVEALTRAGHRDKGKLAQARLMFEQMLTYGNHLGLYSEETSNNGLALGNFPQAFTHLSLISAAYNLDKALG